jgi:hypothetical protein
VSCPTKPVSTVLDSRLVRWCEQANSISDAQFGFQMGHFTVDAIFILQHVIHNLLNNGKQLCCAFIDIRKAFDSV